MDREATTTTKISSLAQGVVQYLESKKSDPKGRQDLARLSEKTAGILGQHIEAALRTDASTNLTLYLWQCAPAAKEESKTTYLEAKQDDQKKSRSGRPNTSRRSRRNDKRRRYGKDGIETPAERFDKA